MRVLLELLRITAIIIILGGIMGGLVKLIYASLGTNVDNTIGGWLVVMAIMILLFVLYRNKLQFSGYYKGNGKVKLSKVLSISLISCSILLLILAPLFQ